MSADINLNWEWPADRAVEQKILIKVVDIKKQGSGLFGLKKSPSLAASLPDPMVVKGQVVSSDKAVSGKTVELTLPKLELGELAVNQYAVLGVVQSKICICIKATDLKDLDVAKAECL